MRRRSFETVLVGPSALVREGLTRILCAANFHILDSVTCVDDADVSARTPQTPILLIVDSGDASDSAVEQVEQFRKQHSAARIAMLADCYRISHVTHAFEVGADAYFVRVANWDAFIKSLELVMLGETILPPALLPFIINHDACGSRDDMAAHDLREGVTSRTAELDATPPLSAREQCILRYLIEGHSNKVIARKVDIAEATVKVHVKTILRKIRVQNRTQAAIWAISNSSFVRPAGGDWRGSTRVPVSNSSKSPPGNRVLALSRKAARLVLTASQAERPPATRRTHSRALQIIRSRDRHDRRPGCVDLDLQIDLPQPNQWGDIHTNPQLSRLVKAVRNRSSGQRAVTDSTVDSGGSVARDLA